VLTEIGEANNWDTSAIAPWGNRTNIPGRDAKGALWAPHRSSDPPDVAVKADDHEWLVATMVQVLPHFFALDSAAPTRGEQVTRMPVTLAQSGATAPERSADRRTAGALEREAPWCNLRAGGSEFTYSPCFMQHRARFRP
jgi:hypothetical protein